MYVCMYVCVYVCMYVYRYTHTTSHCILTSRILMVSDAHLDVITMMDGAAGFMTDTLNDVLSMSKIEGE